MFRFLSAPIVPFFDEQYIPQRLLDASPKTIAVYRVTLTFFAKFVDRIPRLCDLNDITVAAFAQWRLKTVSRGTVKRDMDCLLALWRFAHEAGKLKRGPMIRPIHAPTPTPIALNREQVDAVWEAMRTESRPVLVSPSPRLEVPGSIWWEPLFLLCWDTAERLTPVFTLIERNIDLDNLWVRFPAEKRKGKVADNVRAIHPDTAAAIKRLLNHYHKRQGNSRIFRWSSNDGTLWPRLGAIMQRAGIPNTREFKFHCLRKSSVSHVKAAGGDSTAHAGHVNPVITQKHYEDPVITGADKTMHFLFRPGEQAMGQSMTS
jgi:integrase